MATVPLLVITFYRGVFFLICLISYLLYVCSHSQGGTEWAAARHFVKVLIDECIRLYILTDIDE